MVSEELVYEFRIVHQFFHIFIFSYIQHTADHRSFISFKSEMKFLLLHSAAVSGAVFFIMFARMLMNGLPTSEFITTAFSPSSPTTRARTIINTAFNHQSTEISHILYSINSCTEAQNTHIDHRSQRTKRPHDHVIQLGERSQCPLPLQS